MSPPGPKASCSTSALAVTIEITTSLRAASSAGLPHAAAPAATMGAADSGRRAHTATSCPAASR